MNRQEVCWFKRVTATVLLMTSFTACTTYRPIAAREYIPVSHPSAVYITNADNSITKMQLPKLLGDTLVGYVDGDYREMQLSQVKQMNAKVPAGGRTALAIGAGVLGVVAIGAVVSGTGSPNLCWDGGGGNGSNGSYKPCPNQTVKP